MSQRLTDSRSTSPVLENPQGPERGDQEPLILPLPTLYGPALFKMKSEELLNHLKQFGFYEKLNGRVLEPEHFLKGLNGYTPEQLLSAVRLNFVRRTSHLLKGVRDRVRYFFDVQLPPIELRRKLLGYVGMTLVPGLMKSDGKMMADFPEGTTFWDLDLLQAVTLTVRQSRNARDTRFEISVDAKAHTFNIDFDTNTIYVGGDKLYDSEPFPFTVLSALYSVEPGKHHRAIPWTREDVSNAALNLHERMLMEGVAGHSSQTVPMFPGVLLGFRTEPEIQYTPMLKGVACSYVYDWLSHGCCLQLPGDLGGAPAWDDQLRKKLRGFNREELHRGWEALASHLDSDPGCALSSYLLNWVFHKSIQEHEGLYLVPLGFFEPGSGAQKEAERLFVDLRGFLGRETLMVDGTYACDPRLAGLQVIHPDLDDELQGQVGDFVYDFSYYELPRGK